MFFNIYFFTMHGYFCYFVGVACYLLFLFIANGVIDIFLVFFPQKLNNFEF